MIYEISFSISCSTEQNFTVDIYDGYVIGMLLVYALCIWRASKELYDCKQKQAASVTTWEINKRILYITLHSMYKFVYMLQLPQICACVCVAKCLKNVGSGK